MSISLCLIGCGGHAHQVYADALAQYAAVVGGVRLTACCDVDAGRAASFQAKAGFAHSDTNYHAMLARERPDAVVLVTPFQHTARIAVDVIEHGCHIMLEKPPGKDMADYSVIAEAVARRRPINMVAFNRRNAPIVKQVMSLLYGEKPLAVQHIEYQMYRYDRREAHFHTTAIHGIDMIGHIARAPYAQLDIAYAAQPRFGQGVDNLLLHGRFANGITTQQSYCPVAGLRMERMTIAADDTTLYVETPIWHGPDFPGIIKLYQRGALAQVITGQELPGGQALFETDGFYGQLCEFLTAVKRGEPTPNDIHSALDAMKIADCLAARETTYRG